MKFSLPVRHFFVLTIIVSAFLISFSSCTSLKNLRYFNDLPDSTHVFLPPISKPERVIEYGDRLLIQITAEEKEAIAYFNTMGGATGGVGASAGGYLVNPLGYIEFPILGKIKVLGLTERQLQETLLNLIGKYVKNPLIDVRFSSFRITVLGETNGKGNFELDMQRTTLFQALAQAGDLPNTAKRHDIHIFRDYNGERSVIKFDIRKKSVLTDPEIFELRHNDVIYVLPSRNQLFRDDFSWATSLLGLGVSIISLAVILFQND